MRPTTTDDVKELLGMYIASAALGTAVELRLFWRLAEEPAGVARVSQEYDIPFDRCRSWLELLTGLGFLEKRDMTYAPSPATRTAIMKAYSPETWTLLAQETREQYPTGLDLTHHISHPESVWEARGLEPPDYVARMAKSPERAQRFTRMLYEIHGPLAEELVQALDMSNVIRLMDLGGGSGVMSLALLKRHPNLAAVVVDIANVCDVGREIAGKSSVANRIAYHAADFLKDELPVGFDMILECDVGIYTEELFRKLHAVLNKEGRLVIVDRFAQPGHQPSLQRLMDVFISSLGTHGFSTATDNEVKGLLIQSGFHNISMQVLESGNVIIQAHK